MIGNITGRYRYDKRTAGGRWRLLGEITLHGLPPRPR